MAEPKRKDKDKEKQHKIQFRQLNSDWLCKYTSTVHVFDICVRTYLFCGGRVGQVISHPTSPHHRQQKSWICHWHKVFFELALLNHMFWYKLSSFQDELILLRCVLPMAMHCSMQPYKDITNKCIISWLKFKALIQASSDYSRFEVRCWNDWRCIYM